jgi:hypothetical protein
VRFRRWRVYGERGLAGRRGAVWLSGEVLTVALDEEALAQYRIGYAAESCRIASVTDARLFATRHPSAQPFLGGLGDVEWRPAMPLRPYTARRPRGVSDVQLRLLP